MEKRVIVGQSSDNIRGIFLLSSNAFSEIENYFVADFYLKLRKPTELGIRTNDIEF